MSRPKVITLAPTASDPNGVSTSFTLTTASLNIPIDGALSTGYDRDGVAAAQTPGGAGNLTLDGALASGSAVQFTRPTRLVIYAGGDESGRAFTVSGLKQQPGKSMGAKQVFTETITGPNATTVVGSTDWWQITNIAVDAGTAGDVEVGVNGYVDLSTPQHVSITSAGDDSADTFSIYGKDRYGNFITEEVTGPNATAATGLYNFAEIINVSSDGASAAGVTIGVDGTCESGWFVLNYRGPDFNVGFGVDLSASANLTYDVEHTFNNVMAAGFREHDAAVFNNSAVAAETTNQDGNYVNSPAAMRLAITAHTAGSANLRVVQSGRG